MIFADGTEYRRNKVSTYPEKWPLPTVEVAKEFLDTQYWMDPFPEELKPIGSIFLDMGCDRHYDFCQTPTYGTGYRRITPKKSDGVARCLVRGRSKVCC